MNRVYLMLGGNTGDRYGNLSRARNLIEASAGTIVMSSSIYETAAWGNEDQPGFYNQALLLETSMNPFELLNELLGIEETMGRRRGTIRWQMRTIDIDILYFNDLMIYGEQLTIPHPCIGERRFVLVPMAELAPEHRDPQTGMTIKEMLEICEDPLPVNILPENEE